MERSLSSPLAHPTLFVQKASVGEHWVCSPSDTGFGTRHKTPGISLGTSPDLSCPDMHDAVEAAIAALPAWRSLSTACRIQVLKQISNKILMHRSDLAQIVAAETGKSTAEAEAETAFSACFFGGFAEKVARICETYRHEGTTERVEDDATVCEIFVPYEFPLAIGARKIAAALAAGCTVIVRPDERVPHSMNALGILSEQAELPNGVLTILSAAGNVQRSDTSNSAILDQMLVL